MRSSRLKPALKVSVVCRKMGVAEATFYNWKKYGGLGISELRRLKQLEEENRQLKKLEADLSLDKLMFQDVIAKKTDSSPKEDPGWSSCILFEPQNITIYLCKVLTS
jgi:putative transposase